MGYSTPKKQLDLKEFLSQPAQKPTSKRTFGNRPKPKPADQVDDAGSAPAPAEEPEGSRGWVRLHLRASRHGPAPTGPADSVSLWPPSVSLVHRIGHHRLSGDRQDNAHATWVPAILRAFGADTDDPPAQRALRAPAISSALISC